MENLVSTMGVYHGSKNICHDLPGKKTGLNRQPWRFDEEQLYQKVSFNPLGPSPH